MLNDHPVFGVGYFNFPRYFEARYSHLKLYPQAQLPHNIFIQVGADLGYTGLLIYFVLIKNCFFWGKNKPGTEDMLGRLPSALNMSFLGFLLAGQFVSVVYYPFMWIHLALLGAVKNILRIDLGRSQGLASRTR